MNRILPLVGAIIALMVACGNGALATSEPEGAASASPGEKVYALHCVLCHGKDGTLGISGAKDLTTSVLSREEMVALVTKGRGAMMAYEKVLTKAEIEAVVEHVRALRTDE